MEFEKMLKDPENIDPPFHPNSTTGSSIKRTLSKNQLKKHLINMELWDIKKQERL